MSTTGMSDGQTGGGLGMMRAVIMQDYGVPPVVMDVPLPEVEADEVRVRVLVASINGFDLAMAAGYLRGYFEHRLPAVFGRDFAGVVDAVGTEASRFSVGDPVFGVVLKSFLRDGSFGDYVTVSEAGAIARVPAGVDMVSAAVLGLAGTTAKAGIEILAPAAGETILISGAPGGVGSYAIQLAAARGAIVIATAKNPGDAEYVLDLGASYAVDSSSDLAAAVYAIAPDGVDAVLHLAGDAVQQATMLKDGGRIASALGISPDQVGDRGIQATSIYGAPDAASLEFLANEVAAGRLRVSVDRTFALEDAPEAMAGFYAGKQGKIVIRLAAG